MNATKRIAVGGIFHETHTFISGHTTLADFEAQTCVKGDALLAKMAGTRSGIGAMLDGIQGQGWLPVPLVYAAAMPGPTVTDAVYRELLDELLARLRHMHPVDGVLLALHGAMVTQSQRDVEAEIAAEVRQIVGPQVPIIVELDMHGNVSPRLVELADVLVAYDTNPHIDLYERGLETVAILKQMLNENLQPTAAIAVPHVLLAPQLTGTDDPPLKTIHERVRVLESRPEVVCISVMAGFAYADTASTGVSVIVTTNNDGPLAQSLADALAAMFSMDRELTAVGFPPAQAVAQALAHDARPIILVDSADNIGGGTPGDGTDALVAMLDAKVQEGAIVINDPAAVAACHVAGTGARVNLEVGAQVDAWHGRPVQVEGVVQALSDGVFDCEQPDNHFAAFYGTTIHMGRCAWMRVDGVNILLTERKTPPFDLAQLRHIGIQPEQQKMIVVKSAVAYRAAYLPIAADVIEMDTAGLCSANLERFPFKNLARPCYPLDSYEAVKASATGNNS